MPATVNLIGQRFGLVTVIASTPNRKPNGEIIWACRCDCGKVFYTGTGTLKYGTTQSCGCLRLSKLVSDPPAKTHGGRHERLYKVWRGMIDRCYYPSHNRYEDYGGRGIYICHEWRTDYSAFREWAMASGYEPMAKRGECTIDRINVDGPYAPNNCRWVSMKVQAKNRRRKAGEF